MWLDHLLSREKALVLMKHSQRIGFAKAKANRLTERKLRMTAVVSEAKAERAEQSLIAQAEK